jgi:hypothetical protein
MCGRAGTACRATAIARIASPRRSRARSPRGLLRGLRALRSVGGSGLARAYALSVKQVADALVAVAPARPTAQLHVDADEAGAQRLRLERRGAASSRAQCSRCAACVRGQRRAGARGWLCGGQDLPGGARICDSSCRRRRAHRNSRRSRRVTPRSELEVALASSLSANVVPWAAWAAGSDVAAAIATIQPRPPQ